MSGRYGEDSRPKFWLDSLQLFSFCGPGVYARICGTIITLRSFAFEKMNHTDVKLNVPSHRVMNTLRIVE